MNATQDKTFWKCSKCGYTVTQPKPPEQCPECKETCEFKNVTCYTPECGFGRQYRPAPVKGSQRADSASVPG